MKDNFELKYTFSDFITIYHNVLSEEFCINCIEKFKNDDNKYQGITGGGVDLYTKKSTDLVISGSQKWKREDKIFCDSLTRYLIQYCERHKSLNLQNYCPKWEDAGYQIQETKPGEFYTWHDDFIPGNLDSGWSPRYFTVIWYLNDVYEDGYTEFIDGTKIQPETGKMIIFPATWTYNHRGYPHKSETKYICTTWVHGIN